MWPSSLRVAWKWLGCLPDLQAHALPVLVQPHTFRLEVPGEVKILKLFFSESAKILSALVELCGKVSLFFFFFFWLRSELLKLGRNLKNSSVLDVLSSTLQIYI